MFFNRVVQINKSYRGFVFPPIVLVKKYSFKWYWIQVYIFCIASIKNT